MTQTRPHSIGTEVEEAASAEEPEEGGPPGSQAHPRQSRVTTAGALKGSQIGWRG